MTRKHYNDGFEGPPLEAGITWFDPGQSIDARSDETEGLGPKGESDGALQAQAPNPPVTLPIHGEMREALEGFINDLTDHGRNRANCLSIDHDALNARIIAARNALQGDGL